MKITLGETDHIARLHRLSVSAAEQQRAGSREAYQDLLGHDSPTLHVRRRGDDGLYARYRAHAEHLWASGREMWTDAGSES